MSAPIECPSCGFMNLHDGRECARCRKPLPGRENWAPGDEQSDSQTDISGTDTHETLPPPMKTEPEQSAPEEKNQVPEPTQQKDTKTDEMEFRPPSPPEPEPPKPREPQKPSPEIPGMGSKKAALLDEESLTYTGADTELREISRFFKKAKKDKDAIAEQIKPEEKALEQMETEEQTEDSISRVEIAPPGEPSIPRPGDESPKDMEDSDSFKPEFRESILPGFGEDSVSETTDVKARPEPSRTRRAPISAPISLRALSGAVDLIIYALIFAVLYLGAHWAGRLDEVSLTLGQWTTRVIIPLALMMIIIFIFSETFFALTSGQTPGQMIFDLKTMDEDEQPVTFPQALIRALIYMILILPLGLGLITILLGRNNQGAHEQLSGTRIQNPA